MNDLAQLKDQEVAVLGLGASGLAAARLAAQQGARVTVFDSGRTAVQEQTAANLRAEKISVELGVTAAPAGRQFAWAITSPGIDPLQPFAQSFATASAHGLTGEIELAFALQSQPVVAITGTNGKTTTTELTALCLNAGGLRTLPCGNYGHAFAEVIRRHEPVEVHTVEVSSFQLETIRTFRPKVAVWMNFAPDHLDRHPDLDAYFEAKARIFENQTADDFAVVRLEDRRPMPLAAQTITFSAFDSAADFHLDGQQLVFRGEVVGDFSQTRLRGRHNAENLMAALAAGHCLGLPWGPMFTAARHYFAPHHRCELAGLHEGIEFINDSKATNLHALESCLRALPGSIILIAGGKDKGLDFTPLGDLVASRATHVLAIGQLRPHLAEVWGAKVPVEPCDSLEAAVQRAALLAKPGQTVLLSPGTSSFDMFRSYEHRGEIFTAAVRALNFPAPDSSHP